MVQRIEEIESLEERVEKLEAFNKAIKLRLRQKQEDPLG